jgi:broad specificity phosphatase PhoE
MRKFVAAFTLVVLSLAALPAAAADTVYVMRHLQKAAGEDPPLTDEGAMNAKTVARLLGSYGVKAVFATKTRRAIQTGEPLAQAIGLPVIAYDPRNVPALVEQVRAIKGNVLVVGHSNTVPDLVAAFDGAKPAPLTEADYGTIYVVKSGSSAVTTLAVPAAPERGR